MAKLRAGIEMDAVEMDNVKAYYIDVKRKIAKARHNYKSDDQLSSHRNNKDSNTHRNNHNTNTNHNNNSMRGRVGHEADRVAIGDT